MDLKGFKVRGTVVLDGHNASKPGEVIRRKITVLGTPLGLMTGQFRYLGAWRYCVKAEGENFDQWYQVGASFPGLPREVQRVI